jgi:hypothetical protein
MSGLKPARTGKVVVLPPELSRHWFGDTGTYARRGVEGDGSCFFHSVCFALNLHSYATADREQQKDIAYKFRCWFSKKYAEKEADLRLPPTDRDFCNPRHWADETMIRLASAVLNANIMFLDTSSGRMYCGVHGPATMLAATRGDLGSVPQATMVIAWVEHSHFEPVVRVYPNRRNTRATTTRIRTLFTPSNAQDARMIQHLVNRYMSACAITPAALSKEPRTLLTDERDTEDAARKVESALKV